MTFPIPDKNSLQRAYKITKGMQIPAVPDIILKLQRALSQPAPDTQEVAGLVSKDQAIAGLVLKTVNSPGFGLSSQVDSIHHAVMIMGLDALKNLVISAVVQTHVKVNSNLGQAIWRDSLNTAKLAMRLASHTADLSPDQAFLAGLLQDVGALLIAEKIPQYQNIWAIKPDFPLRIIRSEKENLGTSHDVIGYLFAKHWKLPDEVCSAVYLHHVSNLGLIEDDHLRGLVAVLKIADMIADTTLHSVSNTMERIQCMGTAKAELMVDSETIEELSREAALLSAA